MSDDHARQPRPGRDATTATILEAAEGLFSKRGYTAVTVREIAAAAGVSHALVHRYLGSKADVYRAVLVRRETTILDAAPDEEDLLAATRLMLHEAVAQRRYVKLLVHSALHGLPYDRTAGRFAATERLIELAQAAAAAEGDGRDAQALDPRFVIASVVAMLLGWSAAREWLLPATGLQELDEQAFEEQFLRVTLDLERRYLPSLRDASP